MGRSSKKKKYRIIPGDPISKEEIIERIYQWKMNSYRFEMEQVRVDFNLSPWEKEVRRQTLMTRMQMLRADHERGE